MASRGRLLSALAKAWIAVSTSIEVLRLSASRCGRRWPVVVCSSDRDAWCGWQRWLCRSTCHGGPRSLPVPGEQLVEPVDRRAPGDHPLEHIRQIGLRVEVVQLRRVDQTGQDRPRPGSALTPGEERILTAKCNRPHGPFNRVRVHLDPAVLQEQGETGPVAEHILDRLNQARPARKLDQGGHQPRFQSLHDRLRLGLPDGAPLGGAAAPDPRLDRINLAEAGDDVARERGMGGLVDGDKLATGMGQTERELDLRIAPGQSLVERAHWLTVEWLPKYAPELNDIEVLWRDLKRHHLAHQTFTGPDDLDRAIQDAVAKLNAERHGHPWDNQRIAA